MLSKILLRGRRAVFYLVLPFVNVPTCCTIVLQLSRVRLNIRGWNAQRGCRKGFHIMTLDIPKNSFNCSAMRIFILYHLKFFHVIRNVCWCSTSAIKRKENVFSWNINIGKRNITVWEYSLKTRMINDSNIIKQVKPIITYVCTLDNRNGWFLTSTVNYCHFWNILWLLMHFQIRNNFLKNEVMVWVTLGIKYIETKFKMN